MVSMSTILGLQSEVGSSPRVGLLQVVGKQQQRDSVSGGWEVRTDTKVILRPPHEQLHSHKHAHIPHIHTKIKMKKSKTAKHVIGVPVVEVARVKTLTGYLEKALSGREDPGGLSL